MSLFRKPATIPTRVDSVQHSLEDPSTLVPIYALISEQLAGQHTAILASCNGLRDGRRADHSDSQQLGQVVSYD